MYRCVPAAAGFQFYSAQNRQQRTSSELKEVTALRREEAGDNGIKVLDHSLIGFNYSNKTFATDPLLYCRAHVFYLQEQSIRRPLPCRYITLCPFDSPKRSAVYKLATRFTSFHSPNSLHIVLLICPFAPWRHIDGETDRVTLKNAQSFSRQKPEGGVVF